MSSVSSDYNTEPFHYEIISYKGKTKRYMELAKRNAWNSDSSTFKHGSVLMRGGRVINTSHNKNCYCAFGSRFRSPDEGDPTQHAELGVILGIDRKMTTGSTIYVCRIDKKGDYQRSKPCEMCYTAMKYVGIKKIVWSIDNKTCGTFRIQ